MERKGKEKGEEDVEWGAIQSSKNKRRSKKKATEQKRRGGNVRTRIERHDIIFACARKASRGRKEFPNDQKEIRTIQSWS